MRNVHVELWEPPWAVGTSPGLLSLKSAYERMRREST